MATIPKFLTSVSPAARAPGRRLIALLLCGLLSISALAPGLAVAGEADSEGEGTGVTIEIPDPTFDPGGDETALEEVPASGVSEEETGPVESEPEVEAELPVPAAATVTPDVPAAPPTAPQPATAEPQPAATEAQLQEETAEPPVAAPVEPVANQSLKGPSQESAESHNATHAAASPSSEEAVPAPVPAEEEAPHSVAPTPPATPPNEPHRDLAGKRVYVVQSGDCLWHIAIALLPAGADEAEVGGEVARLWRLNEDRIGTGDPSLIYAGTELVLR